MNDREKFEHVAVALQRVAAAAKQAADGIAVAARRMDDATTRLSAFVASERIRIERRRSTSTNERDEP